MYGTFVAAYVAIIVTKEIHNLHKKQSLPSHNRGRVLVKPHKTHHEHSSRMGSFMKYFSVILLFCGLTVAGQVSADVCDDLPFDKLMDCIAVEGAGGDYTTKPSTGEAYYDEYSSEEPTSPVMATQENNKGGITIRTTMSMPKTHE
jgi:hypothetical protein